MITDLFLQAVAQIVKVRIEALTEEMEETLDFAAFEQGLDELMRQVCDYSHQIDGIAEVG